MKLVEIEYNVRTPYVSGLVHFRHHVNLSGVRRHDVGKVCKDLILAYVAVQGWTLDSAMACVVRPAVADRNGRTLVVGVTCSPSAHYDAVEGWDIE